MLSKCCLFIDIFYQNLCIISLGTCPSHLIFIDLNIKIIKWRVNYAVFFIPLLFIFLRYRYSPRHPVLEHHNLCSLECKTLFHIKTKLQVKLFCMLYVICQTDKQAVPMFNTNTNSLLFRRNLYTYLISHFIDKNAHEVRISLFPAEKSTEGCLSPTIL
jgi:hypothetical protein